MWTSLARGVALLIAGLLALSSPARADIFRAADFSLVNGDSATSFRFIASVPDSADSGAAPVWPDGCTQTAMTRHLIGTRTQYAYDFRCDHDLRTGDVIRTPWAVDGASFVSSVLGLQTNRTLAGGEGGIAVPVGSVLAGARTVPEIAYDYLVQGVLHIWMGWDHLAFVLCLCMIARGRELVGLVTAFTVGHSASLALAFFDLIHIPIPPVEAAIALSIAFMAREALVRHRDGALHRSVYYREMAVVVAFGLLHGLGFASALDELGVAQAERVPALVFFNLGVETGQLLFVAAVTLAMAALRPIRLARPVRLATMYGVGILGCFWMAERITGFVQA